MPERKSEDNFETINPGFNSVFKSGHLSIGLVVPIESYAQAAEPTMSAHLQRVRLAEQCGFSAVWLRDVPFNVPSFGDAGQMFDPFVYLGYLAAQTTNIALGVASIILPLRHPAHVAKSAATADQLSKGRLILGVASGDRPEEYPALDIRHSDRSTRFRASFSYIRRMAEQGPTFANEFGHVSGGIDMLPKPVNAKLPMLITGGASQDPSWNAEHGDGWMTYPRNSNAQAQAILDWQTRVKASGSLAKPVMQPLYFDLSKDQSAPPQPLHLGFRSGVCALRDYLKSLEAIGVNHVALNLRFNQLDIDSTLKLLADELLPEFIS